MDIFKSGTLIAINASFWSGSKALSPADLGIKEVPDTFKLGQKMLVPRSKIKAFRAVESKARFALEKNSFKFPIGSARFVPNKNIEMVIAKLKQCQFNYIQLTEQFVINYKKLQNDMRPFYKDIAETAYFNSLPTDVEFYEEKEKIRFTEKFIQRISDFYPLASTLRSRFTLTWDMYEILTPRKKEAKNQINVNEKIEHFLIEALATLRADTQRICVNTIKVIEKNKVLKGQTISALNKFIDSFHGLNFIGDQEAENLVYNLQKILMYNKRVVEKKPLQEMHKYLKHLNTIVSQTSDMGLIIKTYKKENP